MGILEFFDQYKCTKNEKEHLLDYLCTIRVKRVIKEITDGRTTSLRDMTLKEYSAAIAGMRKLVPPTHQEELRKILRQKRSAVLHQMQLLGINTADWDKVNAFCLDSRIAGMEFRELDCEALDTLQVKLRAIRRKRENKQQ